MRISSKDRTHLFDRDPLLSGKRVFQCRLCGAITSKYGQRLHCGEMHQELLQTDQIIMSYSTVFIRTDALLPLVS